MRWVAGAVRTIARVNSSSARPTSAAMPNPIAVVCNGGTPCTQRAISAKNAHSTIAPIPASVAKGGNARGINTYAGRR